MSFKQRTLDAVNTARTFLEANKVFFETISATLLSVMAIVVSVGQYRVAEKQTQLSEIQTELARQQINPQFIIESAQIKNLESDLYEDNILLISFNKEGVFRSVDYEVYTFIDVEYISFLNSVKSIKRILLTGYYTTNSYVEIDGEKKHQFAGVKNNLKFVDLEKDFREQTRSHGYGTLELRQYLKISYQDVFGKEITQYFTIVSVRGGSLIPVEEGEKIEREYNNYWTENNVYDLEKLTTNLLLNIMHIQSK